MSAKNRNPELKGDRCKRCNGTGITVIDIFETDCPDCSGTGLVNSPNACSVCHGSGSVIADGFEMDCSHCNGSGLEPS